MQWALCALHKNQYPTMILSFFAYQHQHQFSYQLVSRCLLPCPLLHLELFYIFLFFLGKSWKHKRNSYASKAIQREKDPSFCWGKISLFVWLEIIMNYYDVSISLFNMLKYTTICFSILALGWWCNGSPRSWCWLYRRQRADSLCKNFYTITIISNLL